VARTSTEHGSGLNGERGARFAASHLPPAWRTHRLLLGDRSRGAVVAVHGDDAAVLVELDVGRHVAYGVGEAGRARALLARVLDGAAPDWVSLPRLDGGPAGVVGAPDGPRPAPEDDLPGPLAAAYEPATAWDWLALERSRVPASSAVVEALDPVADEGRIRDCLAEANPSTQADPTSPGEAGWFGVREDGRLVGVVGASTRAGDPAGADLSWHLHGLGVRPDARRRGLGAALTGTAAAAGVAAGADWVSLAMFASNGAARRVYERLGFTVDARFSSYRRRG
jgi:ribosomal protein S18 acetylase RimI-like enzyme